MACPAIGPWGIGGQLPVSALPAAAAAGSARATFELVLALAMGIACLGVLLAIVMTISDGRRRNRGVVRDRRERRDRRGHARRLEAERRRADEVTATAIDLARSVDCPFRTSEHDAPGQTRIEPPVRVLEGACDSWPDLGQDEGN
jgi:hypothetical protein